MSVRMHDAANMVTNKRFARILYGSPLATMPGKLVLLLLLLVLFLLSLPGFKEYYTVYPLQLIVGISIASVLYIPTLIALWFFDRREREPWPMVLFTICAVTFFFGPVTSHSLGTIDRFFPATRVVGFVEEFWKVAPLLILIFFLPRAVNGTRDGLVYGALGGFGFAILEFAANSTWEYFPEMGWAAFGNALARANLLGTHNHMIWSATIGAAIGWASVAPKGWKRFAVPIAVYLGVGALHIFEDMGGNILTTMIAGAMLEPLVLAQPNPEQFIQAILMPSQVFFGTLNVLLINIFILPILFVVLRRSGDTERRIIRERLKAEADEVITSLEYKGVVADRRYRTREITGPPKRVGREIVQMQNELAFHKEFVAQRAGNADSDPPVVALRQQIEIARTKTNSLET